MSKDKKVRNCKAKEEQYIDLSDPIVRAVVEEKAQQHNIPLYTKGHSQHGFYFACSSPKAETFMREISNLGVVECGKVPAWLARAIHRNLKSTNNLWGCARAGRSRKLLAKVKPPSENPDRVVRPQMHNSLHNTAVIVDKPVSKLKARLKQCLRIVGKKMNNASQSIRQWRKTTKLAYAR